MNYTLFIKYSWQRMWYYLPKMKKNMRARKLMQEIRKLYFSPSLSSVKSKAKNTMNTHFSLNIMKLRYYENSHQDMSKGNQKLSCPWWRQRVQNQQFIQNSWYTTHSQLRFSPKPKIFIYYSFLFFPYNFHETLEFIILLSIKDIFMIEKKRILWVKGGRND